MEAQCRDSSPPSDLVCILTPWQNFMGEIKKRKKKHFIFWPALLRMTEVKEGSYLCCLMQSQHPLGKILQLCPQDSSVVICWLVNYWKQSNPPLPGRRDNRDLQEPQYGLLNVLHYAFGLIRPFHFSAAQLTCLMMGDQLCKHWTRKSNTQEPAGLLQFLGIPRRRGRVGNREGKIFQISMLKGWKQGEVCFSAQSLLIDRDSVLGYFCFLAASV